MAGAYGCCAGKPGVCLATLGPGATNLVTGVANSNMDRQPIVAITGQAGLDRQHKESHQYYDLVALFEPITKWNASVKSKEIVSEVVRKAFRVASSEKPGATHIDLPEDIAEEEVEYVAPLPKTAYHLPVADDNVIK
jgi:acetolactate synthase-1/2/3 large subunit